MSGVAWYRRKGLKAFLALNFVLLALGALFLATYLQAWTHTSRPQPVWNEPLTKEQRRTVFDALAANVGRLYPYFKEKGVDWDELRAEYWKQARAAAEDAAFYDALTRMLAELHDGHTGLLSYPNMPAQSAPPLALGWVEGEPAVLQVGEDLREKVHPGDVITAVDGRPVSSVVAELRQRLGAATEASMEILTAANLLEGPQGSAVAVTLRRPDGEHYTLDLYRWGGWSAPRPLVESRMIGEFGYLRIGAWRGDVVEQVDQALESLRDSPGIILDVRGNGGGDDGLAAQAAGRFITQKTVWTLGRQRFFPFWSPTFTRTVQPRGPWTYTGPLVLLIDGAVFSSCEYFVGGFACCGRAVTIGTPTGGGSGNPTAITLPGGARFRVSRWKEYFADGTLIEGNGTRPAILVRPLLSDIIAGRDPVLERGVQWLGVQSTK